MINHNRSAKDLADLLHPHPAVTEGVQDCVRMLLGTSIMKPEVSSLRFSLFCSLLMGSMCRCSSRSCDCRECASQRPLVPRLASRWLSS
jgi:hypothetical protein